MKIGIVGCTGRVGQILVNELQSEYWKKSGLELAGGTSRTAIDSVHGFFITDDPEILFQKSDVIIDFTLPDAMRKHAALAAKCKKGLIVGTTGLSEKEEASLQEAARATPIVYSANMSVGVNMLMALVEQTAQSLSAADWDIEIFESHHKHKMDAPSGTALALGKSAAKGRAMPLGKIAEYTRHGQTGERTDGKIGFSVARGGDVVGEHTVYFYSEGERLELTHRATNRALFARGALRAALWTKGKPAGLYSMRDVLGL